MALINHEKKFIFFHIFKCAGNSMRKILKTSEDERLCGEYQSGHSLPRDMRVALYEIGKRNVFDDYFKFTIVRNPFDWLLSTYHYIRAYPNHNYHNDVIRMSLIEFIQFYVDVMMLNRGRKLGQNKCTTLLDFITDENGKVIVDFFGKFENLDADMKIIYEKVGIEYRELPFINVNPTRDVNYRTRYDAKGRELVEKHFAKDLEYFNYKF